MLRIIILYFLMIVEETRSMPWRKKWIDPVEFEGREEALGTVLGKRAYEIWVSEVSK
jgi:A/G-specific adenine glycosylase